MRGRISNGVWERKIGFDVGSWVRAYGVFAWAHTLARASAARPQCWASDGVCEEVLWWRAQCSRAVELGCLDQPRAVSPGAWEQHPCSRSAGRRQADVCEDGLGCSGSARAAALDLGVRCLRAVRASSASVRGQAGSYGLFRVRPLAGPQGDGDGNSRTVLGVRWDM